MNKERLIIKNFGPIKSVDLDFGKITILIGEQASGKSTVAKVLAICRYFSYIVNYSVEVNKLDEFSNNEQFENGLRRWDIESYLKNNSEIIYENSLYKFEFRNELITEFESAVSVVDYKKEYFETNTRIISKSPQFTELLNQLQNLKRDELAELETKNIKLFGYSWSPNENFYRLNVKKIMDNPLYIPTERVIQFQSVGSDLLVSDALRDELSKLNRIRRGYQIEMEIEPLSLIYKNIQGIGAVKKNDDLVFHNLHNGASGYQSTIPIVLAVKFYNGFDSRRRTFIIEEPEQNLFPKAQKKLTEFLVKSVKNNNHSLLLTTHSPYILTAFENLMFAQRLGSQNNGEFKNEVTKIISEEYWINQKDVNVYFLDNEGEKDLMQREEVLIDKEYIDGVSEIINKDFDKLLEIEMKLENNSAK